MKDIELVIKIPEAQYRALNAQSQDDVVAVVDDALLIKAIKNGKPLDELLNEIRAEIEKLPSELTYDGRRMIRRVRVYDILDKYGVGK